MCRLLAALRLSTHTEHVLPPHLAARFHKLPVCRGDGGESSPIRAFSAQVQPVIVIENACEATDANLTTKSVNADAPECKPGQARSARSQPAPCAATTGAAPSASDASDHNGARRPCLFQHHRCVRGPWCGRLKPPAGTL